MEAVVAGAFASSPFTGFAALAGGAEMTGGAAAVEAGTVWENSICPQTNPTARIPATQADTVTIGFTMQGLFPPNSEDFYSLFWWTKGEDSLHQSGTNCLGYG